MPTISLNYNEVPTHRFYEKWLNTIKERLEKPTDNFSLNIDIKKQS